MVKQEKNNQGIKVNVNDMLEEIKQSLTNDVQYTDKKQKNKEYQKSIQSSDDESLENIKTYTPISSISTRKDYVSVGSIQSLLNEYGGDKNFMLNIMRVIQVIDNKKTTSKSFLLSKPALNRFSKILKVNSVSAVSAMLPVLLDKYWDGALSRYIAKQCHANLTPLQSLWLIFKSLLQEVMEAQLHHNIDEMPNFYRGELNEIKKDEVRFFKCNTYADKKLKMLKKYYKCSITRAVQSTVETEYTIEVLLGFIQDDKWLERVVINLPHLFRIITEIKRMSRDKQNKKDKNYNKNEEIEVSLTTIVREACKISLNGQYFKENQMKLKELCLTYDVDYTLPEAWLN